MTVYVTLDGYNVFAAQDATEDAWNGWAAPAFTRTQADALAAHLQAEQADHPDTQVPVWDPHLQSYVMTDPTYPDDTLHISADADGLYPIGAYQWTWTVYDGDPERDYVLGRIVLHGPE